MVAAAGFPAPAESGPKSHGQTATRTAQSDGWLRTAASVSTRSQRRAQSRRRAAGARPAVFCADPLLNCAAQTTGTRRVKRTSRTRTDARTLQAYASAGPVQRSAGRTTTDRGCLAPKARALLNDLEAQFGPVTVVSTCRRGAVIAGTRRPSLHRYGKAIDFIAPPGRKTEVIRWLRAHSPGVTMTYARMKHIHTDVGEYRRVILGAGSGRSARRQTRQTQVSAPNTVW